MVSVVAIVHVVGIFAGPKKSFSGHAFQAFQIDAVVGQQIGIFLGEIVAHDADEIGLREKAGGERDVSGGAAEHAVHAAVRGFDAIIGDGTNDNQGHLLIVAGTPGPISQVVAWTRPFNIELVISLILSAGARNLPDLTLLGLVLLAQAAAVFYLLRGPAANCQAWIHRTILISGGASGILLIVGFLLMFARVSRYFPVSEASWIKGSAMIWAFLSVLWTGSFLAWRVLAAIAKPDHAVVHTKARRQFLKATGAALFVAPVAVVGYGVFVERTNIRMREQKIVDSRPAPRIWTACVSFN